MPPKSATKKRKAAPQSENEESERESVRLVGNRAPKVTTIRKYDDISSNTLEHPVNLPPSYIQHHIPLVYDGEKVQLNSKQEEIISFFAAEPADGPLLGNPKTKPVFKKSFFDDLKEVLPPDHVIKDFNKCNFDLIRSHLDLQKDLRKSASADAKKRFVYFVKFNNTLVSIHSRDCQLITPTINTLTAAEMKVVSCHHKGLFHIKNVFKPTIYDDIKQPTIYDDIKLVMTNANSKSFVQRPHTEDQGIDDHPVWMPKFSVFIQQAIHDYINKTDIPSKFGFNGPISPDCLSASFILKYDTDDAKSHETALSFHNDVSQRGPNNHILSVVYTIKSADCIGGAIKYSSRSDGTQTDSRDVLSYLPEDDSIYVMNGDYVAHCAMGVSKGCRYAVVLFYDTPQTDLDVVCLWNGQTTSKLYCDICYKFYKQNKDLNRHYKKCKREKELQEKIQRDEELKKKNQSEKDLKKNFKEKKKFNKH